jgi:hypothetical protein
MQPGRSDELDELWRESMSSLGVDLGDSKEESNDEDARETLEIRATMTMVPVLNQISFWIK